MAACDKSLSNMTPGEAYQCFLEADIWKTIARNHQRMWGDFTGTTIGEWLTIIAAFLMLPAQFASYILPLVFLVRLARRATGTALPAAGQAERRRCNFWSLYMIIVGTISAGVSHHDRFMFLQGAWEVGVGLAAFLLGPSWWYRGSNPEVYVR